MTRRLQQSDLELAGGWRSDSEPLNELDMEIECGGASARAS